MNVVVTGAAGYIGTCLCKMLLEEYEDINIKAFDNFHYNHGIVTGKHSFYFLLIIYYHM